MPKCLHDSVVSEAVTLLFHKHFKLRAFSNICLQIVDENTHAQRTPEHTPRAKKKNIYGAEVIYVFFSDVRVVRVRGPLYEARVIQRPETFPNSEVK